MSATHAEFSRATGLSLLPRASLRRAFLIASIGLIGCGSTGADRAPSAGDLPNAPASHGAELGSLGIQLTLPGGQAIPVITWAIAGPNGAATLVQSGSVASDGDQVKLLVGGLQPGIGYRITLSGAAIDGSVTCTGSAPFDIVAHATTAVVVELACTVATTGAQVTLVNGTSFDCAAWSSVSANPTNTTVGTSVMLSATATGPSPGNLSYAWSATGGTFGNFSAPTTTFTCTSVGTVNVTLTVADGPVPAGSACNQSLSTKTVPIVCTPANTPPPPAAPALPPWALAFLATVIGTIGAVVSGEARRRRSSAADCR
jgi:hypothetical protein